MSRRIGFRLLGEGDRSGNQVGDGVGYGSFLDSQSMRNHVGDCEMLDRETLTRHGLLCYYDLGDMRGDKQSQKPVQTGKC